MMFETASQLVLPMVGNRFRVKFGSEVQFTSISEAVQI